MSSKNSAKRSKSRRGILFWAHAVLVALASLYSMSVILVMTPFIQTHVLYAHRIDFFGYSRFDHPESYGLAPGKTTNLKLRSSDNTTLGAWFILSDPFYYGLPYPLKRSPRKDASTQLIPTALRTRPTILFFHGNTGTRALHLRVSLYTAFTGRLGANVMTVDYRGFGDSEGHPSVEGVARDARAAWDWLVVEQGARPEDVVIVGHSLGTAVAALLAAQLGKEGARPRGLVLMSPFSSVRALIDTYYLFGFLPLLKPLVNIPGAPELITRSLVHKFDTLNLVPDIKTSVLLVHAENDWDIPSTHSSSIFEAFLEPHLLPASSPSDASNHNQHINLPANPITWGEADWEAHKLVQAKRAAYRRELVTETRIPGFGYLEEMGSNGVSEVGGGSGRKVALLNTHYGGHDIGRVEGVQDVIGRMFGFIGSGERA